MNREPSEADTQNEQYDDASKSAAKDSKEPKRKKRSRETTDPDIIPTVGYAEIYPDTPTPTLTKPHGSEATSYRQIIESLRAITSGDILLVIGAKPTTESAEVALNLAISSTRAGLKTVLVDADTTGDGVTQYLRTGQGPGLAELASGSADLKNASRLLTVGNGNNLPVIPTGRDLNIAPLGSIALASAIDLMIEHSNLIFIGVPHNIQDDQLVALGAHADGSVLIVTPRGSKKSRRKAAIRMSDAGAPIVGIIEQATVGRRKRRYSG